MNACALPLPAIAKVVFAGPVGAGKTTLIRCMSDIVPVGTDELASDEVSQLKPRTTVALDYGLVQLTQDCKVHCYGTPGQARFDFMWDILSSGASGVVILLNHRSPQPLADLDFYLDAFSGRLSEEQMVIGVTKMDGAAPMQLDVYRRYLRKAGYRVPVMTADARLAKDGRALLSALMFNLAVKDL